MTPASGELAPGQAVQLAATLVAPGEAGALSGELLIMMRRAPAADADAGESGAGANPGVTGSAADGDGWDAEPAARCAAGAAVVACSYELRLVGDGGTSGGGGGGASNSGGGALAPLDFGAVHFGERRARRLELRNLSPLEARFELSFGPVEEMGPADAPGAADDGGDAHARFLRLARIRARARESPALAVRVAPLSGVVPPYGAAPLTVTFWPRAPPRPAGFAAQAPDEEAAAAAFDYVAQVDVAGAAGPRSLRFAARGRGVRARLLVAPRLLHFGAVAAGAWGDRLVTLTNAGGELPLRVEAARGGAYFAADIAPATAAAALSLAPGASCQVAVRYRPKALGLHEAAVEFRAVAAAATVQEEEGASSGSGDGGGGAGNGGGGGPVVLAAEAVTAVGSCVQPAGRAARLPGGLEATPETFARPR